MKALFEATFPPVDGPRQRARRRAGATPRRTRPARSAAKRKPAPRAGPYERSSRRFTKEKKIVLSDDTPFAGHLAASSRSTASPTRPAHAQARDHFERAFLMELVLEGLVQSLRIAREDLDSTVTYAELAKFNLMRSRG